MELNGEPVTLTAGDLVTAPIGTSHGTVNHNAEDMEFFVVEVFPGTETAPAPVLVNVADPTPADPVGIAADLESTTRSVELGDMFTGPWRSFAAIELAPRARLERDVVPDGDEVLFITGGLASIEFGGARADGERGLCVGVPPGAERAIVNRSVDEPLTVLSTVVGLEA
jgi:mannose-6-phosphate isomerase-like protein (cupin superfamily)